MAATQLTARTYKVTKHGIEVPTALTYKSWEPGGEYTKPLILKNINLTSKKIRYKMPQSQIFSTTFPQPIVLGSGTSHTLPVTFKPLEKRMFSDYIEILTNEGSFLIPIRAILPTANLSLPSSLQFGMCSVLDNITMDFNLSNISDVTTNFQWDISGPFRIEPVCGVLKSRGLCKMQASFHPENVSVFEGVAVCLYGEKQEFKKSVMLEGIGKYPHLVASVEGKSPATTELSLSFGDVPVGQTALKWIHLTNVSPVSTSFEITSLTSNVVFTCSQHSGVVSPENVCKFKVMFQPRSVESCCEQFMITPKGGISNVTVKCSGRGQGADVEIVQSFINFGNIACGTSTTHLLQIKNNSSNVKAIYQFQMLPCNGIFSSEGSSGVVAPSSTVTIILHFTPTRPIAYHKKLVCLVHILPHPLYVDLIGTAFTETTKPAVIHSKHLMLYTSRVELGLSRYSPEQLQQLIASGKLIQSDNSSLIISDSFDEQLEVPSPIDCGYAGYLAGSHDPTSHHVSVDSKQLEFDNQHCENKVNITNHTLGKLYCIWTSGNKVFSVIPEERELLAGACCTFTVTFSPPHAGKFYSTILDCYVCYKSMRDQQDNDYIITTPWCVSVHARGHTIIPATEAYLPRAAFNPAANILMPSTVVGHKVYQTVLMINNGNSPIAYDFQLEHGDCNVYPSSGLLQDNHQVFIVTMESSQASSYQYVVKAKLNGSDKFTEDLTLCGMVEYPTVKLEYNGDLYFMPTCIQCSKSCQLSVTNVTGLQLDYHWRLLEDCNNVLSVLPQAGTLLPFEIQYHTLSFTPQDVITYKLQALLVTNSNIDPTQKTKSLLNVTGQGELGHLKCDPDMLQLNTLVVGTTSLYDVMLHNVASCELTFHLSSSLHILHLDCSHSNIDDPAGVELGVNDNVIPAGGKKVIRIKIRPCVRGQHTLELKYRLEIPIIDGSTVDEQSLCSVVFNAVYPTLNITSVMGDGSLNDLSKSRLWKMLSIDQLNKLLQGDPSPSELRYALKTRYSTRRKAAVHTNAISEITFGASPVNMPASVIHLEVENKGQTPTHWAFQFPEDLYLEPAYWAKTGELDQIEKDEMNIMDNEVFNVHHRTGYLEPSQVTTITLSFKHQRCGSSRLPVLLKIGRGREILLFFHGVTVPIDHPYIFFTDYHHHFIAQPIGSHAFPVQVYELYNGGDKTVNYFIDTQPLEQLREENYQMNILECLQPSGVVPARGSTTVQFVFAPQEVKCYIVELAINFEQHKTVLISFTGEGYDPSQLEFVQPGSSLVSNESSDIVIPSPSSHLLTSGQVVKLSHEMISFGHFPLFATINRIIFLRNSTTHTMSYEWMISDDDINEVLTFTPSSGYLQPLEAVMCKVTFLSRCSPQLYSLTIPCKITDETAVLQYKEQLTLWEEQEEERKHLFTITEQDVIQQRKAVKSSQSDLNRYQALPPIGHSTEEYNYWAKLDLSVKPKSRPRTKKETKLPPRPEHPSSTYIRITINATTYSIADYSQQFDDLSSFFIDKQAITIQGGSDLAVDNSVNEVERDIITSITTLMLKDLLSDGNIINAIKKISEEPLPYFVQYAQKDRNTGGHAHARHSYAAALEQLSRVGYQQYQPVVQDEQVQQEDQVMSDGYNISQKTTDNTTMKSDVVSSSNSMASLKTTHVTEQLITLEDSIKHLPDFGGMVEEVLNGTILNIAQETIAGEASITKLLPTIATPHCNNN